jgi:hypothetical protein
MPAYAVNRVERDARSVFVFDTETDRLVAALGTYSTPVRGLRSRKRGHVPTGTVATTG